MLYVAVNFFSHVGMFSCLPGLNQQYSAILSTFIKLPFVIKTFLLSIFEWPFDTGFTVCSIKIQDYYASTNSPNPDQTLSDQGIHNKQTEK